MDDLRVIADEFQDGVAGLSHRRVSRPQGRPDPEGRGPQGQGGRHQRRRQRASISPSRAMLNKHGLEAKRDYTIVEAPFPDHAGDAGGEEGRPDSDRAAVLVRSGVEEDRAPAVHQHATRRHHRNSIVWTARKSFIDKNRAAHGRFHGGHDAHRALVSRSEESRRGGGDRVADSPSRRRSGSAGCSPKPTITATRHAAQPRALQKNIDMTNDLGFVKASFDVKRIPT